MGSAAIFGEVADLAVDGFADAVSTGAAAAGAELRCGRLGTRLPKCALIRFGISFWRDCNAWKNIAALFICQTFATCGFFSAVFISSAPFWLAAASSSGVRANPKWRKESL